MYLPVEVLDQVAKNLVKKRDIAAAALVNWGWYSSFTPVLYRHVEIDLRSEVKENGPDVQHMAVLRLISALNRNPYLSSLVHSITHKFRIVVTISQKQAQTWEKSLRDMQLQLQEIIDRNGFPKVTELWLYDSDIRIADMLLRGLYPQLELLHLATPHFRYLPFGWLAGLPSKLRELDMEVPEGSLHDPYRGPHAHLYPEKADGVMDIDTNAFLASSSSLRTLRISRVARIARLFNGVTLPHLHTLEVVAPYFGSGTLPAAFLASFLDRHQSISRLAVSGLSYEGETVSSVSRASNGIRELISCIESVSDGYFTFLRKFTHINAFKLECDGDVEFLPADLLKVIRHLHRDQLGLKVLVLPMPQDPIRWLEPASLNNQLARDLVSGFGMAFKDYLPEVEVFGIHQIGMFLELDALTALVGDLKAKWAQALAGHPRLRRLAVGAPFLSSSRVGSKTRQEAIDEIAQEFSALPRLEQLVFPEETHQHAVQVLIVRGELGAKGKATIVDGDIVVGDFFDSFFEDTWGWAGW